jgi:hypothetical protein
LQPFEQKWHENGKEEEEEEEEHEDEDEDEFEETTKAEMMIKALVEAGYDKASEQGNLWGKRKWTNNGIMGICRRVLSTP